ncbi:MAG: MarR family winged helix-turn-helix transcriptional regulator [Clostridia bacterium]
MDYDTLAEELGNYMTAAIRHPLPKDTLRMSQGELGVLGYLNSGRDGVSSGELRAYLHVVSGRMGDTLRSLERKGMIRRAPDPCDSRRVLVRITQEGCRYVERERSRFRGHARRLLEELGEEDARAFVRLMKRVAEIKEHAEQGKG